MINSEKIYIINKHNKQFKCIDIIDTGGFGVGAIKQIHGGSDYRASPTNSNRYIEGINGDKIYIISNGRF